MDARGFGWSKENGRLMDSIKVDKERIITMKKEELDDEIKIKDEKEWKSELEKKKSIRIYKVMKNVIQEENYDNTFASILEFRWRTNTLPLGRRLKKENGKCPTCQTGEDELNHLTFKCPTYEHLRPQELKNIKDEELDQAMLKFLRGNKEKIRKVMTDIWKLRTKLVQKS